MKRVPRDRFLDPHRQLEEWSASNEAKRLSDSTVGPTAATAEETCPVLWDKPFFMNRGDSISENWKNDIRVTTDARVAQNKTQGTDDPNAATLGASPRAGSGFADA